MTEDKVQHVIKMPVSASSHVCYALTIFQTVNEDGAYSIETSYIGDPPQSAKIGLLLAVLDRERERMSAQWKVNDER